jgi:hypothetical protein
MSRQLGWFFPGRTPVIYLDPPPNARLAFAWGAIVGAGTVAALVGLMLVWPVATP